LGELSVRVFRLVTESRNRDTDIALVYVLRQVAIEDGARCVVTSWEFGVPESTPLLTARIIPLD